MLKRNLIDYKKKGLNEIFIYLLINDRLQETKQERRIVDDIIISKNFEEVYRLAKMDRNKFSPRRKKDTDIFVYQFINICKKIKQPVSYFESELIEIGKEFNDPELKWYRYLKRKPHWAKEGNPNGVYCCPKKGYGVLLF